MPTTANNNHGYILKLLDADRTLDLFPYRSFGLIEIGLKALEKGEDGKQTMDEA